MDSRMADATSTSTQQTAVHNEHITEDEASLYDRQIRLWGLEAQNRMRSSTVCVLSLRFLAHETIKNLVLAGIGRLIVMDDGVVTEEDLGGGFLFREEEGAVGQERTAAALPQIASLNPLVSLTALPTLAPFVRDASGGAQVDSKQGMVQFLKREKVDVVVACDLAIDDLTAIDAATREAGSKFYGAGTYGFFGYVFADLGDQYNYVHQDAVSATKPEPQITKRSLSYPSLSTVLNRRGWSSEIDPQHPQGSPYRGLRALITKTMVPSATLGVLGLWEFQKRTGHLPTGPEDRAELEKHVYDLRSELGVNAKSFNNVNGQELYDAAIDHLANHATHFFPPTLAILGGFLAQDVLRALSQKDTPIHNLLVVDSMGGTGTTTRWAMMPPVDDQ